MSINYLNYRALAIICVIMIPVAYLSAQAATESRSIDALRARIQAPRWQDRMLLLREVEALDVNSVKEKISLIFELLDRENKYIQKRFESEVAIEEGFSDPYYSELLDAALVLYRDNKSALRYSVLVQSAYNSGSPFALELSRDAAVNMNELTRQSISNPNPYSRLNAASLLAQALHDGRFLPTEGKNVRGVIIGQLSDVYAGVRIRAISLLENIGGEDIYQALLQARDRTRLAPERYSPSELDRLNRAIDRTRP